MKNFVVTISRTCGSGGTSIAKLLSKEFGISYYDKDLMKIASDDSGISEAIFAAADQDQKKSIFYMASKSVYDGEIIPPESDDFTSNDNLFAYQAKVMKELVNRESFIVIGRAADFVLKEYPNVIRVFVHAPLEDCIAHEMEYMSCTEKEAKKMINRTDSYRGAYYKYHTGRDWHDAKNFDLSLDTSIYSYDECTKIIKGFIELVVGKE